MIPSAAVNATPGLCLPGWLASHLRIRSKPSAMSTKYLKGHCRLARRRGTVERSRRGRPWAPNAGLDPDGVAGRDVSLETWPGKGRSSWAVLASKPVVEALGVGFSGICVGIRAGMGGKVLLTAVKGSVSSTRDAARWVGVAQSSGPKSSVHAELPERGGVVAGDVSRRAGVSWVIGYVLKGGLST